MAQIRLQYGSYQHNLSDAAVSIRRIGQFNDAGIAYANREVWTIQGRLEASTQGGITMAIQGLENAYLQQNKDISLKFEGGSASAHSIRVIDTLDGIRVVAGPGYPTGQGAEYSTFRNYTITVEAMVKTRVSGSSLVSWQEIVEVSGGRPRDTIVETLNTLPVKQRVADATAFIVHQSGRAVGLNGWPTPPGFLLPFAALLSNRVARRSPRTTIIGGFRIRTMYEVTWAYSFAESQEVTALPNGRPG